MGAGEDLGMEPGVADRLRRRFVRHGAAFEGTRRDVVGIVDLLEDAAGEYAGVMRSGSDAFGASWEEAVTRSARSAELIAANVNNFAIDLERLDTRAAHAD